MNEKDAFEEWLGTYYPIIKEQVYRLFEKRRVTETSPESVMQSTFRELFEKQTNLTVNTKTIIHYATLSALKRKLDQVHGRRKGGGRTLTYDFSEATTLVGRDLDPGVVAEQKEVYKFLSGFDKEEQEILLFKVGTKFSLKEIAAVRGQPVEEVRSRWRKIRQQIGGRWHGFS